MPTYQYACTSPACGLEFERVQAFTDTAITDCPDCSGRVRKVYGSVGVVFKGSGFYRTDSRDTKSADSKATDSSKSSVSDSTAKTAEPSKTPDASKPSSNSSSGSNAKPVAAAAG